MGEKLREAGIETSLWRSQLNSCKTKTEYLKWLWFYLKDKLFSFWKKYIRIPQSYTTEQDLIKKKKKQSIRFIVKWKPNGELLKVTNFAAYAPV